MATTIQEEEHKLELRGLTYKGMQCLPDMMIMVNHLGRVNQSGHEGRRDSLLWFLNRLCNCSSALIFLEFFFQIALRSLLDT